MYHRYMRNESGRFQKQRVVPPPMPKPAEKKPESTKQAFSLPFLSKLMGNADSGDLLVMLILLLLLAEGNEESDSVVMTLAIFLFLQ